MSTAPGVGQSRGSHPRRRRNLAPWSRRIPWTMWLCSAASRQVHVDAIRSGVGFKLVEVFIEVSKRVLLDRRGQRSQPLPFGNAMHFAIALLAQIPEPLIMRFFAPRNVLDEAEAIIRGLIELSLKPRMHLRKLATEELSQAPRSDLLLPFSLACRADLDNLHRTVHSARRIPGGPSRHRIHRQ